MLLTIVAMMDLIFTRYTPNPRAGSLKLAKDSAFDDDRARSRVMQSLTQWVKERS